MSKMYLIGNSHIDPVWLWRWQDGFSEILATFRSALDRMKDFDDFKYTSACSAYYEFIEKLEPEMFEEIRQRVKEGRWCLAGGWILQPDCNIPCGESFARHALIGQRYFKERFGLTARTGYNVDSFGHNASLPKILKQSGLENYVFMRPNTYEQGRNERIFNWESDDGSSVLAYRIPGSYGMGSVDFVTSTRELLSDEPYDHMYFIGVGNHGGGPTIKLIEDINALPYDKVYSTPDEYFDSIRQIGFPKIKDELQHHARGCYSALTFIKTANRRCEQNLLSAEKLCVMANRLTGYTYPAEELKGAWKNLLFNQFHDIMGGCSVKKAYDDASYSLGETMNVTEKEIYFAMQKIAGNVDTLEGEALPTALNKNPKTWEHERLGTPVVIFNPHAYSVKACVSVNERAKTVLDANRRVIPHQIIRGDFISREEKYHTAFIVELPAFGYTTCSVYVSKEPEAVHENEFIVSDDRIENSRLILELDRATGDISKLYDKESGKYIVDGACEAILLDETECDTWAHGMDSLGETVGAFEGVELSLIESGPVRATVRSKAKYGESVLIRDFSMIAGGDSVSVKTSVDFREKLKTLKFTFPVTDKTVIAETAFGKIERPLYTGEEPCGKYIVNGSLAIVNDSKYAYDTKDGKLRLTVLRGAIYADHHGVRDEFVEYMEQGIHEFTYSLHAHKNFGDTQRKAELLNFPPRHVWTGFHNGKLEKSFSGLCLDADNVLVSCIKQREDGKEAIIRIFDAEGIENDVNLNFFDKKISTRLSHNAIKTLTEYGDTTDFLEY